MDNRMNTLKLCTFDDIPKNYTGAIEWDDDSISYRKNGKLHKEDGPAHIREDGVKFWDLDGVFIWDSNDILDLTNQIILSKTQHPLYPTVQVWKILDKNGLREQIKIPGMEEFIIG